MTPLTHQAGRPLGGSVSGTAPARSEGRGAPADGVAPATLTSEQLMQGQKAVAITHNGTTYRLQATRLGKLILTK